MAQRIIYNAQARFAGSPYHQGFDTPTAIFAITSGPSPMTTNFLARPPSTRSTSPAMVPATMRSIQREQLANTFLRTLGVPWLNRRHVAVYVNGSRRGTLMEDAQTPDTDIVKEHFPNDADGWLYKMQPWFEFGPFPSGVSIPFQ